MMLCMVLGIAIRCLSFPCSAHASDNTGIRERGGLGEKLALPGGSRILLPSGRAERRAQELTDRAHPADEVFFDKEVVAALEKELDATSMWFPRHGTG